ncbi:MULTISPECIES: hypothetical protein [unclassified Microbacterium]|uniref:hypothetical protein n=1 Tax=unclassified Microbacterium TaxID=2609290 RepID=UPI00386F9234
MTGPDGDLRPDATSRRAAAGRGAAEARTEPRLDAPAERPIVVAASVSPPSGDAARAAAPPTMPGAHRGGFQREMTQPLPVAPPLIEVHPDPASAPDPQVHWIHRPPTLPRSGGWAMLFGILALLLSLFVGWGFPVGMIGVVLAILALRRPWERRETAVWALGLSVASLLFSAGWLWWAASQGPLFS